MNLKHDVRTIAQGFQIHGEFLVAEVHGSGHINDTYCTVFGRGGARVRYILQRIYHLIFRNPLALKEYVSRVTAQLDAKAETDRGRRTLTLIAAHDGKPLARD